MDKEDLINQAKQNHAPEDVMHVMEQFSEREYQSVAEVAKEVGKGE